MLSPRKFAEKLDCYRRLKRMTTTDMAQKCGVHPDTMERLVEGRNAPNAKTLKSIEKSLDIQFEPEDFETDDNIGGSV